MAEFKTDDNGNVILKPMTGWEMRHVAGMLMILGIEYSDSPEELEKGLSRTLPLILQPALALDFAEALKREASNLLAATPKGTSLQ
jgi:hypothetical protein